MTACRVRFSAAAVFVAACAPVGGPVTFDEVSAACDLDDPEICESVAQGDPMQTSLDCAHVLSDAFGIRLWTFGEDPSSFSDTATPGGLTVAALRFLSASCHASVKKSLSGDVPQPLATELREDVGDACLSIDESSGRLWYEFLNRRIDVVAYTNDEDVEYRMRYSAASDSHSSTVSVSHWISDSDNVPDTARLWATASLLVHEATHAFGPAHVQCNELDYSHSCDEDPDGSFGAEAWWGLQWFLSFDKDMDSNVAMAMHGHVDTMVCGLILEPGDFSPCTQ